MADEFDLVKISELPAATTPGEYDVLAGVQTGDTKQFSFAVLLAWMQQSITATAIGAVPQTRKVNNHALTGDITLTASDVGAIPTSEKGANGGVAELDSSGKVPSAQLPAIPSTAADVTYDNTQSGLTADDVQDAIDELARGGGGGSAASVTYDPTTSGLTATNVQDAIDEVVDDLDGKANQSQLAYVETGTTASRNYTAGWHISLNGLLYTAATAIASGATFYTSGGNKNLTECVGGGFNSIGISQDVSGITWGRITKRNGVVTITFTLSASTVGNVRDYQLPAGYYRQGEEMFLGVMYRPQGTVSYYSGFIGILDGQITIFQYTRSYGSARVDAANTDTILGTVTYLV